MKLRWWWTSEMKLVIVTHLHLLEHQIVTDPKLFFHHTYSFLDPKFLLDSKIFQTQIFYLNPFFVTSKFIRTQIFFYPNFSELAFFWNQKETRWKNMFCVAHFLFSSRLNVSALLCPTPIPASCYCCCWTQNIHLKFSKNKYEKAQ